MSRPARAPRGDGEAIAALRRLKAREPDLGSAIDLQIALLDQQRRVQSRVQLPNLDWDQASLRDTLHAGRPSLLFDDVQVDWTEFSLMLRKTAELLHRHGALEEAEFHRIETLTRDAGALAPIVRRWYDAAATRGGPAAATDGGEPAAVSDMMDQVILLAMRPFLTRCMQAVLAMIDLTAWTRGYCPLCGGEPEFALITTAGERILICGRCTARWRFQPPTCPFCAASDPALSRSFASPDRRHRVYACDGCRRYLKAYDARQTDYPLIVPVEQIATMRLDAAAMQKGYGG